MSAAQPGELREALAEALSTTTTCHGEVWPSEFHYRQIDALLPVVTAYADSLARERAAAVLRAAAMEVDGMDTPGYVRAKLRARAAALTADDQPVQP